MAISKEQLKRLAKDLKEALRNAQIDPKEIEQIELKPKKDEKGRSLTPGTLICRWVDGELVCDP